MICLRADWGMSEFVLTKTTLVSFHYVSRCPEHLLKPYRDLGYLPPGLMLKTKQVNNYLFCTIRPRFRDCRHPHLPNTSTVQTSFSQILRFRMSILGRFRFAINRETYDFPNRSECENSDRSGVRSAVCSDLQHIH